MADNDLVNRVAITKSDLLEALRDYLFKGSIRGDTSQLTEVVMNPVTLFDGVADDYVLINLVLKLGDD